MICSGGYGISKASGNVMGTFGLEIIGHRGAAGLAPENTMAGFTLAADLQVPWIEYDVVVTADQQAVIFHDDALNRCSDGTGVLAEHSWQMLSGLDVGGWFSPQYQGQRMVRFAALLPFLQARGCGSHVELKKHEAVSAEDLVAAASPVLAAFPAERIIVSSFDPRTLMLLHEQHPELKAAILLENALPHWQGWARAVSAEAVHIDDDIITEDWVQECLSEGWKVRVYTVNDPVRAKQLAQWGVSGIFTDFPDRFLNPLQSRGAK